jgi:23S rRNA (adenine2503-C2)-methyltransferase
MQDIKEFELKDLEKEFLSLGIKAYHARQVFSWIYKKGVMDFNQMSDIPKALKEKLIGKFFISEIKLLKSLKSSDSTQKLLLGLRDGNCVEAVVIPTRDRVTGCVSSQVGCKFKCSFCASGILGFKRNLTTGEIIDEVIYLRNAAPGNKITNLVFMGTGEPMDNYANVMKAIRIINSGQGFNVGARKITISTSGIIPGIEALSREELQVELSVSLHAAEDKLRSSLMPVNKKYPLKDLIRACKEYSLKTNRQVTFEYILIGGVNASFKNAQELVALLRDFKLSKVNIIPFNPVKEFKIQATSPDIVKKFRDYLAKHGVHAILRKERGEDIGAACGQLRLSYAKS